MYMDCQLGELKSTHMLDLRCSSTQRFRRSCDQLAYDAGGKITKCNIKFVSFGPRV
jgi:hypothetical protein